MASTPRLREPLLNRPVSLALVPARKREGCSSANTYALVRQGPGLRSPDPERTGEKNASHLASKARFAGSRSLAPAAPEGRQRFSSILLVTLLLVVLSAGRSAAQPSTEGESVVVQLMEDFFEAYLTLDPSFASTVGDHRFDDRLTIDIAPQHREKLRLLIAEYLRRLDGIDRGRLSAQQELYHDVFRWHLEMEGESLSFPAHLLPIVPGFALPSTFPQIASGQGFHRFESIEDYDNFLLRMEDFVEWVEQAIKNLRQGMERGIVHPKSVVRQFLPELEAQFDARVAASPFLLPIRNLPPAFEAAARERLSGAYRRAITERVQPAYRRLHRFLRKEYLPACRSSISWSELPDGARWYRYLVRFYTTSELEPEEIFELGMREVERLDREFLNLKRAAGFPGDLSAFHRTVALDERLYHTRDEDVIADFELMRRIVRTNLPSQFRLQPSAGFEIRPIEEYREASTPGAFYESASPDGRRPGVFYVNLRGGRYPKYEMDTLFLHEALPGHHFQISLARENEDLPRLLRFGYAGDFVEGWALYSEGLGRDLGLFTDPMRVYGYLVSSWVRANHLVADVGIHYRGWSRSQAERFLTAHGLSGALAEIDRYTAVPAQALTYKLGALEIRRLRREAEGALGEEFDVREFHHQVLANGALPLRILRRQIERWIDDGRVAGRSPVP